ncbi:YjeF protein [Fructilactobacillus florum 8D]|uniref:ADP-dependent (S)-NAD(P)H-hydrate dehydratase n=2 Tax=Fructilactobacillus florum TaxID=640331 RepID=W9EFN7_9LACO|nr:NAD(P)H-hydrate dehydratase [Fructilactobacillus florum]EKK20243.1 YjeF protein [Fructilactobacillus florum 2F]ETO40928.1 YjeF protein [Fructilactobacillus florum 8D]KRM91369.1 YjeF-like protein [Fructilactobacillus florum DSM 22689 = JCM 16035]
MQKITSAILPQTIRIRPNTSFKGTYGKAVLVGGNQQFGGAIIMATLGAVYAGTGLTTTLTDPINFASVHNWVPEAMTADYQQQQSQLIKTAKVVAIGPGLGVSDQALHILKAILAMITADQILILDGSALTLIANHQLALPTATIVLTPHQIEWERLSGLQVSQQTTTKNRIAFQQILGSQSGYLVLKSHRTCVYTPTDCYENTVGTPAQATGGMGDTLVGIITGFLAQFTDVQNALLSAVYTHSAIAEQLATTQYVVLPHQISAALPTFMKQHEQKLSL